jgi:hypothetical protein
MNTNLIPILPGEATPPLWEIGWARSVERSSLRTHLGEPFYVETDSSCTFGGEEDWWSFRTSTGHVIAVCLRVPYQDAVLCANLPSGPSVIEARALLQPWPVELFTEPRLR